MKRFILLLITALGVLAAYAHAELPVDRVAVISGDTEHEFTVEIAATPEAIQQGLMFREELAPDAGMLFDFGVTRPSSMWMKNTLVPLDMLFALPDGTVIAIAHNAVPGSLRSIDPGVPVRGVLEIPGGRARELGINPGDVMVHPIFGNRSE